MVYTTCTMRESACSRRRSLLAVRVCFLCIYTHSHTIIFIIHIYAAGWRRRWRICVSHGGNSGNNKTSNNRSSIMRYNVIIIIIIIIGGEPRLMINREPIINVSDLAAAAAFDFENIYYTHNAHAHTPQPPTKSDARLPVINNNNIINIHIISCPPSITFRLSYWPQHILYIYIYMRSAA